jgi:hypothetical protein
MRNWTMALVLLAVLAMTDTSYAGLEVCIDLSATQPTVPGYTSWLIKLGGARSFSDIGIWKSSSRIVPATVVQSNYFDENWDFDPPRMDPVATVWGPNGPSMPPNQKKIDTHMMIAKPGIMLGKTGVETNTAYGPDGFGDPPVTILPVTSNYYTNLGTFTSEHRAAFSLAAPLPAGTPFMQIVIPDGTNFWMIVDTDAGRVVATLLPEPSTIVTLIIGAACVVGFRWRRKRA